MTENLPEALTAALEFERRGHEYYMRIATDAENPLTRRVFSFLAEEELYHIERIRELYEGAGAISDSHPHGSIEDAVKDVFRRFESRERDTWTMDNAEAYEYAMNLEQEAVALYGRLASESEKPAETDFFSALQAEENLHLTALENVFNYLQHTGDWFASEESGVWNWMNT